MNILLHPVITKVPESMAVLKGKYKVAALSTLARESAKLSSLKSNLYLDEFKNDVKGAPIPINDIYWSVSHKPGFVAGVVSSQPIGIDVEKIKDVSKSLFERILDPNEACKFKDQDKQIAFFRAFTAKESVLKNTMVGIRALSKVKIKTIVDDNNIIVRYLNKDYLVENFYFDGYLASVTKDQFNVQWTLGI